MMHRSVRRERELNNSNPADQHSFVQEEQLPTHSWAPESFDVTSGDEDSLMGLGSSAANKGGGNSNNAPTNLVVDPVERRSNAMQILHALLYDSAALEPHLIELLCAK
jgi:E3 ubiquitin-protein ligase EDD1